MSYYYIHNSIIILFFVKGATGICFDLGELSRCQQKAIELADNIINDHLKSSDLSDALCDVQGNPIAKFNGDIVIMHKKLKLLMQVW